MTETNTKLSEYIAENFGANASYVEGLLARFQSDPTLVDETWRTFFSDLISGNNGQDTTVQTGSQVAQNTSPSAANTAAAAVKKAPSETSVAPDTNAKALTGASKKIVENMEQSLSVPTATSLRTIPVKLLEENRKIINTHMQGAGRGKVSFTHLIGWAIVKAAKDFPHMNQGYGLINGAPSRLENQSINLGIAIDVEKKDGSRNLLVPNIKDGESMSFAHFFNAYNEQVKKARDGKLTIEDFQGTTISLTNPGT